MKKIKFLPVKRKFSIFNFQLSIIVFALLILAAACGQSARNRNTTETVAGNDARQQEHVAPTTATPPDLSAEKGITTYLTGTWKFVDTQSEFENPGCTMIINSDLTFIVSFYHHRTKEEQGICQGKISLDRFFANPGEAPDLLSFRPDDTERSDGGDYFFRHETVYDGKRVMTLCFAGNGDGFIFDRIGVDVSERYNGREYVFEQETGEQSTLELRKDSEFYAVYWSGNREWMWLDDIVPNVAAVSLPSVYSPAKTCYRNEVKESIRYPVSPNVAWSIGNKGMVQGVFYAIQTDRQGQIVQIRNTASCDDPLLETVLEMTYNMPDLILEEDYYREKAIYIKYRQTVNGYNAEVIFMPEEMIYDKITGPATLTFTHQKTGKKIKVNSLYFAVPSKSFPDFEEMESFAQGQTCYLDYGLPEDADEFITAHPLYYGELPFFFADVNFDGKQELLLTRFGQGQRGCSSYIVFSFTPDGTLEDFLACLAPFNRLDDFATIDRENRQIIIQNSNGADDSFEEVYKPDDNGKFHLTEKR